MLSIYSATSETTGETYHVTIDQSRDTLLSEASHVLLKEGKYMLPEETSPQEAFARASIAFGSNQDHAQRLYDAVSRLWFMYASPVLSNAGNPRGLPASCALTYMGDSREEIADSWKEMLFLSTLGAGVGLNMSALRSVGTGNSRGTSTPGLIPFMKVIDSITLASKQGEVRRGATAVYLDIGHPEFQEFLVAREASDGGDINRKCQNIHHAVNIPDVFMEAVVEGKDWYFVDPHTKQIKGTTSARTLWMDILKMRMKTGEPYLHFIDASNRAMPQALKDKGLRISQSNLCAEVVLPTSPTRTAMCFLSSLNLELFEDWRDSSVVEDAVEMLDNVVEVFIRKAPPELWKAVASAKAERSIGLGMMGFHSYLQAKGIPFEGVIAAAANRRMFSHIHSKAIAHSKVLAKERGEAPDMEGTGERFSFISAIAPNASSSVLCNFTSPSVEPFNANIFVQKTRRGAFILKNKHLNEVLEVKYGLKGEDLEKAWDKIQEDGGSVQDLLFMDAHDKDVFKTAFELDQRWIVEHAAQRQPFISQAQSVNLFFPLDITTQVLHTVHKEAWEKGLKTLYYVRSKSASQIKRTTISTADCVACEG
jgi:ribonucleoside-diphosphate reductase alpha chain